MFSWQAYTRLCLSFHQHHYCPLISKGFVLVTGEVSTRAIWNPGEVNTWGKWTHGRTRYQRKVNPSENWVPERSAYYIYLHYQLMFKREGSAFFLIYQGYYIIVSSFKMFWLYGFRGGVQEYTWAYWYLIGVSMLISKLASISVVDTGFWKGGALFEKILPPQPLGQILH